MTRMMMVFALAGLAACVEDLGEGRTAATVSEPVPTAAPAPAAGNSLTVDRSQSSIKALGAKITAKHPIDFGEWSGDVTVDGDTVTGLSFTVQVASLVSDADRLTDHLKKEDFLFVDRYPTATFVSSSIADNGDGTATVSGDLTIRGVTRRVTFPATIDVGASKVTANTEFTIDRQDFGVTYPGKADDAVQDTVVLTIGFVAPRG